MSLRNNILTFNLPNIMLPDSASDQQGSHGFVQYRIKPKANLQAGTQIKNTAYIYFDYNSAIVTNTTITDVMMTTASNKILSENLLKVYPNPGTGKYNIELPNELAGIETTIKIYTIYGSLVTNTKSYNTTTLIDLGQQPNGVYILNVSDLKGNFYSKRIIKE